MAMAMASAERGYGVEAIPFAPVFVALDRDRVAELRGELAILRGVCAALEGECIDLRERLDREAALNRTLAGLLDAAERAPLPAPTPVQTVSVRGAMQRTPGGLALAWAAMWSVIWAVGEWFEAMPIAEGEIWRA